MSTHYEAAPRQSLLKAIATIADEVGEEGVTLDDLFTALGERVFGAMLFILALPCCIPFLYGVPQVVSVPMMAIAAQMAIGRASPWLPGRMGQRRISKAGLVRMAEGGRKWLGWLERFSAPRLMFVTHRAIEPVIGLVLLVFCASILTPLPLTNSTPAIAVAIVAYGMIERDGLLVSVGLVLGVVWISLLGAAAYLVFDVLTSEDAGTRDVLRALFERVSAMVAGEGAEAVTDAAATPTPE